MAIPILNIIFSNIAFHKAIVRYKKHDNANSGANKCSRLFI